MRVMIVSAWDPKSGVATVYRLLARHLASHGVRYSAFAFDGWGQDTWWTFCDELIDGQETTLAEVLMSGRYDLIHCIASSYSPPWGVETWVRRARFRGPIVLMSATARRELSGPAHATRYVAPSAESAEQLALDADGEVVVIPNAFDEEVFFAGDAQPRERPLLVWVGRSADTLKDLPLFLEGLELLPDHDAIIVDTMIDSPEADLVRERLGSLGSRVQHIGPQSPDELAKLFRMAAASGGAYVSTSRYEGFQITLEEAMACGCAVVAPSVTGLRRLADGRTAIVFDRSHGALALFEAVTRSRDPVIRSAVVRGGLDAVARWSSAAMAERYLRVYEDALAEVSRPEFVQRTADQLAREAWRMALLVRPYWLRLRALAG